MMAIDTFQGDQSTTPTAPRWWAHNLRPRYNVCPTDPVDVVTAEEGKRELITMRWGLIPRWWLLLHLSYSCVSPYGPAILVTHGQKRTSPYAGTVIEDGQEVFASRHRSAVREMTRSDSSAPSDIPFSKSSSMRPI